MDAEVRPEGPAGNRPGRKPGYERERNEWQFGASPRFFTGFVWSLPDDFPMAASAYYVAGLAVRPRDTAPAGRMMAMIALTTYSIESASVLNTRS